MLNEEASNWHSWKTSLDFYKAILPPLGAPDWHGENVNALVESMVWGEINTVDPPYTVEVHSTKNLLPEVIQEINWTIEDLAKQRSAFSARKGHDAEVDLKITS